MKTTNELTVNDIKKILYKGNPIAKFTHIRKGYAYYKARISFVPVNGFIAVDKNISFEIPIVDMGDADFFEEMQAKHLIRWILAESI